MLLLFDTDARTPRGQEPAGGLHDRSGAAARHDDRDAFLHVLRGPGGRHTFEAGRLLMSSDNRPTYFVPRSARWPIEAAVALLFMAAGGALWLNEEAKG